MLIIDYREHALINILKEINSSYESDNLLIGDIHVKDNLTNETLLVIERKTKSDLSSSIKDGRWREQKKRMKETGHKILYIIEKCNTRAKILDDNILDGALLNTILRDGISIYYTESSKHTIDIINTIDKKLNTGELQIINGGIDKVAAIKKSTKIIDNIFIHQLNAIPGVSISIATQMSQKWRNMKHMIEEIGDNPLFCAEMQMSPKRKIGKKLSEKIFKCICGNTEHASTVGAGTK